VRGVLRVVMVGVLTLVLAGCVTDRYHDQRRPGGITAEQAETMLTSVPGVTGAQYVTASTRCDPSDSEQLNQSEGMDLVLKVTFADDVHLSDPADALDQLARLAWSVNVHYPRGYLTILFDGGVSSYYSWGKATEDLFTTSASGYQTPCGTHDYKNSGSVPTGESSVSIEGSRAAGRYGDWPGNPPDRLDLTLVDGAPQVEPVPALDSASVTESSDPVDGRCWDFAYDPGADGVGRYQGRVEVDVVVEGQPYTTVIVTSDQTGVTLCGLDRDVADPVVSAVFTPMDPGDRFGTASVEARS